MCCVGHMRTAVLLVLAVGVASEEMQEAEPESYHPSELDAMSQVVNSEKMKGMKFGKREEAADGKSGRIFLEPENADAEPTHWQPKFATHIQALKKRVQQEDLVLVYFFSSAEEELNQSHENGKRFDEAAQQLIEGEYEVTALMVDVAKTKDDVLKEWGVLRPQMYKVFVNGKPTNYRGSTETAGLVASMNERAGPPTTKLDTSAALDAHLANATSTVVVGVFGPAYQGSSSRELFADSARELRDAGRLSFVEVSTKVANGAQRFAGQPMPFDTATSVYAVVRSPKWLGKAEEAFHTATDFRKMTSFINGHAWTVVSPFSESLVTRAYGKLVCSLLLDTRKHASKLRYVVKQYHKLIDALEPAVRAKLVFAITHRSADTAAIEHWIAERFERTTINGEFYGQGDKFAAEWAKDFSVIVSETKSSKNWASNEEGGASPDKLLLANVAPWLMRVARGEEAELAQGDDAAAAAGLKEMKMGFGPDGGMISDMGDGKGPKKKKAKKAKGKKGGNEKGEL